MSQVKSESLAAASAGPWVWLARAAAVLAAVAAAWFAWVRWVAVNPSRLIGEAYTQRRPFEYRLPSAAPAPVRLERAPAGSFQRPAALLEAEAKIARELSNNPDSAKWLALRAHAEMLSWEPEAALATLQRALEWKPDDPDLLADLGMAYALRADAANRPIDYSNAIEYLSRALKAKPRHAEAAFNRAVVYERMYLYEEGVREWRRCLELDKTGPWGWEAQRRLADLEHKRKVRQTALAKISVDPEALLRRIADGDDVEPESYLDLAVTEWLPRRWDSPKYEQALSALAAHFVTRHRDLWLRDVLAAPRNERATVGLAALAAALKANLADESDRALEQAPQAARHLRAAGHPAAALRAESEYTYALDRSLTGASRCVEKAAAVEGAAEAAKYSWILAQAILEQGNCLSRLADFGGAQRELARALARARHAGYNDLALRAAGILPGSQTEAGNLLAAWELARDGLATYWSGPYSGVRAQQIYFNLVRSAESMAQNHAALVFARAAALAIADTPRRRVEANTRARAARLAVAAGWPEEAKAEFQKAGQLFDQLEGSQTNSQYRGLADLHRAEAQLSAGNPGAALKDLETARPRVQDSRAALVRIRFQQDLGDALWRSGRNQEAEPAYQQAVALSEQRLDTLRGFQERSGALVAAGGAYRGLVELDWGRGDVHCALRRWEWFRAGEASDRRDASDLDRRLPQLRSETFLAYAVLPGGLAAWVFDDRGIEGHRLTVKPEQLEAVGSRFLRQCADPTSNLQAVRRDARQLYDWLVAPLAHRLDPSRTLVIEPDGAVGAIPMAALMDQNFHYLGERFAITVAGGLADYLGRAGSEPVHASVNAVVVAGPALGQDMARGFPPLPQALNEGKAVAHRFRHSVLVSRANATLAAVEQHRQGAQLFHFAGHGFSSAGNGGLLLAPGADASQGAGVLNGRQLERQDWGHCRLAVLSACSTGTGEARGPVNPESLVRGFLWAGVARVVATRWNVDAETGALLMDRFYEALLSGTDVPVALAQAAHRLRENKATSHPYFWAGFQSFGTR